MNAINTAISNSFTQVKDPRKHHSPPHALLEIITLTLCAVSDGAGDWVAVEKFGRANETWLRRFLRLPNGIPSHDTLGNVFAAIDPAAFEAAFCHWTQAVSRLSRGQIEPFDGQTVPHSPDGRLGKQAIRMIRVWADQNPAVMDYLKLDAPAEPTPVPASSDPLESMSDPVLPEIQDCPTGANLPAWNDWRGNWFGFEHRGWPPIFSGAPDRYDRFAPYPIQPFNNQAAHIWPGSPQTGPALPFPADLEASPRTGQKPATQSHFDLSGLSIQVRPFTQAYQTSGQLRDKGLAVLNRPGWTANRSLRQGTAGRIVALASSYPYIMSLQPRRDTSRRAQPPATRLALSRFDLPSAHLS